VPGNLHEPIRQDAILPTRAKANADAQAFLAFLKTPEAKAKIKAAGYETDDN
jgi:molybdate transport system substrate-binding protein